jgi:hypothetical protein
MVLDSFGLVTAYVVIAALLLVMLVITNWHWVFKALSVIFVSGFFYVTYHSLPDFMGWPTAYERPDKMQVVAIYIDAPNKVYLWGHDMAEGIAGQRPRAYELKYTTRLNNSLNIASHKIKKGFPMIAEFRPSQPTQTLKGDGLEKEPLDEFELIFYDVPAGLAPSGKKE